MDEGVETLAGRLRLVGARGGPGQFDRDQQPGDERAAALQDGAAREIRRERHA